MTIVMSYIQC